MNHSSLNNRPPPSYRIEILTPPTMAKELAIKFVAGLLADGAAGATAAVRKELLRYLPKPDKLPSEPA